MSRLVVMLLRGRGSRLRAERAAVAHLVRQLGVGGPVELVDASRKRTAAARVLELANVGQLEAVAVASIETFGPPAAALAALAALHAVGAKVRSARESWASSPTPGLAEVARWLSDREAERKRAVAKRALGFSRNRLGVRMGRPRVRVDLLRAAALVNELGFRRAASELVPRVGETTLRRLIAASGLRRPCPTTRAVSLLSPAHHAEPKGGVHAEEVAQPS